jgi:hypothetical protein
MTNESDILKKLSKTKHDQAFNVPENYFETFLPRLQDKITLKQKEHNLVRSFFNTKPVIKFSIVTLSSIFIVLICFKLFFTFSNEIQINDLKDDEIAAFLNNEILTIDESTIASEIDVNKATNKTQSDNDIKYLIDNNIESSDILTEL